MKIQKILTTLLFLSAFPSLSFAIDTKDLSEVMGDAKVTKALKGVQISTLEAKAFRCPKCYQIKVKGRKVDESSGETVETNHSIGTRHGGSFSDINVVSVTEDKEE